MFRTGNHWGRTIIWEGEGEPDENGRRPDDELVGVTDSTRMSEVFVEFLNQSEYTWADLKDAK